MKGLFIALLAFMAFVSSCKKECYICHATCYNGDGVLNGDTIREVCDQSQIQYLKDHNAHGVNGTGCPWTCILK